MYSRAVITASYIGEMAFVKIIDMLLLSGVGFWVLQSYYELVEAKTYTTQTRAVEVSVTPTQFRNIELRRT